MDFQTMLLFELYFWVTITVSFLSTNNIKKNLNKWNVNAIISEQKHVTQNGITRITVWSLSSHKQQSARSKTMFRSFEWPNFNATTKARKGTEPAGPTGIIRCLSHENTTGIALVIKHEFTQWKIQISWQPCLQGSVSGFLWN